MTNIATCRTPFVVQNMTGNVNTLLSGGFAQVAQITASRISGSSCGSGRGGSVSQNRRRRRLNHLIEGLNTEISKRTAFEYQLFPANIDLDFACNDDCTESTDQSFWTVSNVNVLNRLHNHAVFLFMYPKRIFQQIYF